MCVCVCVCVCVTTPIIIMLVYLCVCTYAPEADIGLGMIGKIISGAFWFQIMALAANAINRCAFSKDMCWMCFMLAYLSQFLRDLKNAGAYKALMQ